MDKRRCANCIYAVRPLGRWFRMVLRGWGGLLTCLNHPDAPGQMMGVSHLATCRNFRGKGERHPRCEVPEPPDEQSRIIPLTRGKFVIVDAADYEWLSRYQWFTIGGGRSSYYAGCHINRRIVSMHRLIMNPPPGKVVDHFDGNGLNNRRANLRICTQQQNQYNMRPRKGKKSRFVGVYQSAYRSDRWYAYVQCQAKRTHLGPFTSEVEAAIARDLKAIELHGPYARLNFPDLAQQRVPSTAQTSDK
jgi:hypothetical protein